MATRSFLTRKVRAIRRDFASRARWPILTVALIHAAVVACLVVAQPRFWQILIGIVGTSAVWMIVYFLQGDGGQCYRDGRTGEQLTQGVLKKLRKHGWSVLHSIPLRGRDIDHALIGPAGVIAVESKFTNTEWRLTDTGLEEVKLSGRTKPVQWPLDDARDRARDLGLVVLAVPGRVRTTATPVLVLWGPQLHRVDGGHRWVNGVLVAIGKQWQEWLPQLTARPLSVDEAKRAIEAIKTRRRNHREAA